MYERSLLFGSIFLLACLFSRPLTGQQTLCYPLDGNLGAAGDSGPDLSVLTNAQGENGAFISTDLPANFCPQGGTTTAFHFEDNVGLAFDNNAAGLIDCDYTVEFTVNFEELPANQLFDSPWIWIFGTYQDDDGIFIWRETIFGNIFIEFWDSNDRLKTVEFNDFNTTDWFHFTITRNCAGQVNLYINCELFTTFNDTRNILRLHPETGNTMLFFQDDPAVTQNDAAPGKVRDIKISDFIKEESAIAGECDCLCESLTLDCQVEITRDSLTCDPALIGSRIDTIAFAAPCACQCDSIITTTFRLLPAEACVPVCEEVLVSDTLLCPGTLFQSYVIKQDTTVCDTTAIDPGCILIECTTVQLLPTASFQLDTLICAGESVLVGNEVFSTTGTFQLTLPAANGCDSLITLDLTVLDGQTIPADTTVCTGTLVEDVLIQRDTAFCKTVSGTQGCQTTFCYNVRVYPLTVTEIQERFCPGDSWAFGDTLLTSPGLYSRTFEDRNGCDSLVQLQLDTIQTPSLVIDTVLCFGSVLNGVVILADTLICETLPDPESCLVNRCYQVKADTAYIFEQQERVCRGETFAFGDSVYAAPGTYLHRLKAANGCDSVIALVLTERLPPLVSITGSSTLCPGKTSVLNAGGGFADYEWMPTGESTQIIELGAPGVYTVRVTDEFGCRNEKSIEVVTVPPVEGNIEILQTELCPGSSDAVLQAISSGGTLPVSYQWSDGSNAPTLSGISAGTYELIVRDGEGCTARDTVNMEPPVPFDWEATVVSPSCPDSGDGAITVNLIDGNGPFLFGFKDGPLSPDSVFAGLSAGTYFVMAEDINGCRQELTAELMPQPLPNIGIDPPGTTISEGDSVVLNLVYSDLPAVQTINWTPPESVDCDTCSRVVAQPAASTDLSVSVVDVNGCRVSTSAFIEVVPLPEDSDTSRADREFFVPNAFSPNGDGINDVLMVFGAKGMPPTFAMKIFNRWGELVYEGSDLSVNDSDRAWNGKVNGGNAPAGVYLWSIVLSPATGPPERLSGQFMLMR